jgi:hypothetical protein
MAGVQKELIWVVDNERVVATTLALIFRVSTSAPSQTLHSNKPVIERNGGLTTVPSEPLCNPANQQQMDFFEEATLSSAIRRPVGISAL